jgi:hypothetical protein
MGIKKIIIVSIAQILLYIAAIKITVLLAFKFANTMYMGGREYFLLKVYMDVSFILFGLTVLAVNFIGYRIRNSVIKSILIVLLIVALSSFHLDYLDIRPRRTLLFWLTGNIILLASLFPNIYKRRPNNG